MAESSLRSGFLRPGGTRRDVRRAAEATAELIAVLVAVTDGEPRVLTIGDGAALPSGPFELTHRSLQAGMRTWVEQQTHHPLGYVEQLYTFADRDRTRTGQRVVSISYVRRRLGQLSQAAACCGECHLKESRIR